MVTLTVGCIVSNAAKRIRLQKGASAENSAAKNVESHTTITNIEQKAAIIPKRTQIGENNIAKTKRESERTRKNGKSGAPYGLRANK